MKSDKEIYENLLNHVIKKQYPFIERIEVHRYREHFNTLMIDINILVDIDFIIDHVSKDCYDQMDEDDIFFSLWSFNHCSDIKIDEKKLNSDLISLYKMSVSPGIKIYGTNSSISVIGIN